MKFRKGLILLMLCALAGGAANKCKTYEEIVDDAKDKGVEGAMFPDDRQVRIMPCEPVSDPGYLCSETYDLVMIPYSQKTEDGLCAFRRASFWRSVNYTAFQYKAHFSAGELVATKPRVWCNPDNLTRCQLLEIYNGFAALPQECR